MYSAEVRFKCQLSIQWKELLQPLRTLQSEILIQFNARSLPIKERPYRFRIIRDHQVIWIVLMITDKRRVRTKRYHASNIFMSQVQNQNKTPCLSVLLQRSIPSSSLPNPYAFPSPTLHFHDKLEQKVCSSACCCDHNLSIIQTENSSQHQSYLFLSSHLKSVSKSSHHIKEDTTHCQVHGKYPNVNIT